MASRALRATWSGFLFVLAASAQNLPVVDLGYRLQQASSFNETLGYYNFSNIRYAAPPIGDLRFRAPQAPETNLSSVYDGNDEGRICPQASGAWSQTAQSVVTSALLGLPVNYTRPAPLTKDQLDAIPLPPQDPRTSEDCLFLDVFAPQRVFDEAGMGYGAPVLVWIYGGGYTGGNKISGSPTGLFMRAEQDLVFVAMNYRLGAFGFLSGPTMQTDGDANAGLLDQRFALEWVQKNIHLFGGDPNKVTIFGESAGGGSIMHQITAYGGLKGKVPFQQAIPQSPGWAPVSSRNQQEQIYNDFVSLANASSLEELRSLDSEALLTANFRQVYNASYGNYVYGPVVDGYFAPAQPGELLAHGHFDKSVRVMVGHNGNEGLVFTPPYITSDTVFRRYITEQLPLTTLAVADYIASTLYPPVFDGSLGYRNDYQRAVLLLSESVFTCNSLYLGRAFGNRTYAYIFNLPPAIHGQDVAYTYWTGGNTTAGAPSAGFRGVQNATIAVAMQEFFTSFAQEGRPNGGGVLAEGFDMYGNMSLAVSLNVSRVAEVMDTSASARCEWWQLGLTA